MARHRRENFESRELNKELNHWPLLAHNLINRMKGVKFFSTEPFLFM